ncbi:MAG: type II toxin-antitoxin system HicB family antitoxin [Deltaproteobacteria bacterium]|nr:MAG: type II toxin-antitoxin system HicB family antitoxin [Deltaproteobacteria bacterium]
MPEKQDARCPLNKEFPPVITKEEQWYVARCLELGVVSQGKTSEEATANLKEAVELYLESFGEEELESIQAYDAAERFGG